jgi:hypothetical protein
MGQQHDFRLEITNSRGLFLNLGSSATLQYGDDAFKYWVLASPLGSAKVGPFELVLCPSSTACDC